MTLTVAQVAAFETSKVVVSLQLGQQALLADTTAHIQALTAAQIAELGNLRVTQIAASDANVALTVAQAAALESAGVPVAAPSGSLVTVSDTAAHLQTLTTAQINGVAAIGVSGLVATNAAVKFAVTQTIALEGSHLTVKPFPERRSRYRIRRRTSRPSVRLKSACWPRQGSAA